MRNEKWIRISISEFEFARFEQFRLENDRFWEEGEIAQSERPFVTTGRIIAYYECRPESQGHEQPESGQMITVCLAKDLEKLPLHEDVIFILWPDGTRIKAIDSYFEDTHYFDTERR